ncbi:hypothetical protein ROLI_019620 [Roseobacter fucihabitans]|uniref:Transposase n=1 Tax=Roseobacter fucihabitans TaxID=1537242 RepID=A0ABZ2BVG0_9RHOB|nr:hypothetical protein [Roseobacter litoralis]
MDDTGVLMRAGIANRTAFCHLSDRSNAGVVGDRGLLGLFFGFCGFRRHGYWCVLRHDYNL